MAEDKERPLTREDVLRLIKIAEIRLMSKVRTIFILGLVLGIMLLGAACSEGPSPPPAFGVSNPNVIPDGSGGIVVAYQVNKGHERTTFVQRLGAQGNAQWGNKGVALYSDPGGWTGREVNAQLVSDGKGGTIIVWPDDGLWAQKLDVEGHFLWRGGNIPINGGLNFKMVSDNSGGAVIGWLATNLCLQIIDGGGSLLWNNGKSISRVEQFDIASDDLGNAFVAWEDQEQNFSVQKLDPNGTPSWSSDGLLLSAISYGQYVYAKYGIISDGTGGAIVVWEDEESNVLAQRISAEGKILWKQGGVFIGNGAIAPQILSDGSGGAIVFWGDFKSVYAQRINSSGRVLWTESGIQVGQTKGRYDILYYHVTGDSSGGAAVVWNCTEKGNPVLRAQRIDSSGRKLWDDNGILVSTVPPCYFGYDTPAFISPDGYGGFIVSWAAGKSVHQASSSYVQKISAEGKLRWGEKGIRLDR